MTAKAPKTVGPNLQALTIREQADLAWRNKSSEERQRAERAARRLALRIFGDVQIVFDEFVPESFARRHGYEPKHLVTFEIEGLEFNYNEATSKYPESLRLIDECPCGRGPRLLAVVEELADIGYAFARDHDEFECQSCMKDRERHDD